MNKVCRSVLYMPASNARAIEKSFTSLRADAYIYDLEDSVAPASKVSARDNVKNMIFNSNPSLAYDYNPTKILRINSLKSPFFKDDIAFLADNKSRLASINGILLAKAESSDQIAALQEMDFVKNLNMNIWCMIETPLGVMNVFDILKSSSSVTGIVLGLEDLCNDLRCKPRAEGRFNLLFAMEKVLMASKAVGREVCVIDGVYTDLKNDEGFRKECIQGRDLGMTGKSLIHPKTIDVANEIFSPTNDEIEKAKRMIECFEEAEKNGRGVAVLDNVLVEELHVRRAKQIVAIAQTIGIA